MDSWTIIGCVALMLAAKVFYDLTTPKQRGAWLEAMTMYTCLLIGGVSCWEILAFLWQRLTE